MNTVDGWQDFTVRGFLSGGASERTLGGRVVIMDIYAAQLRLGRTGRFDRIDVIPADGIGIEECRQALRKRLGAGFEVSPPGERASNLESTLGAYRATVALTGLLAAGISIFIIFSSFSVAVVQRRQQIGILRAVGAGRGQVFSLFFGEGIAFGAAGGLLGVAMGELINRYTAVYLGRLIEHNFGTGPVAPISATDPRLAGTAILLGVVTSAAAAAWPALQASLVQPVRVLTPHRDEVQPGESLLYWNVAGLICAAIALLAQRFPQATYAGYAATLGAFLCLAPWLTKVLMQCLARCASRWTRIEFRLAALGLAWRARRTAGTLGALTLSLAAVCSLGGVAESYRSAVHRWLENGSNADVLASLSPNLSRTTLLFPDRFVQSVNSVEGVAASVRLRRRDVRVNGRTAKLIAADLPLMLPHMKADGFVAERPDMRQSAAEGRSAVISENLSNLAGLHLGSTLRLETPRGPLLLPVSGIVFDFSDQAGSVFVNRNVYREWWEDDTTNLLFIYLTKGAGLNQVLDRIRRLPEAPGRLLLLPHAALRQYMETAFEEWFGASYTPALIATFIAVIGIVNSLVMSVNDRRRELAILKTIGGSGPQLRLVLLSEGVLTAVAGLALGSLAGGANLFYTLELARRGFAGFGLEPVFPVGLLIWTSAGVLIGAAAASWWPAAWATRQPVVEGLRHD